MDMIHVISTASPAKSLRIARIARGLTQTDLARRVERSLALVGAIETGRCRPSIGTRERLAKGSGCDPLATEQACPSRIPNKQADAASRRENQPHPRHKPQGSKLKVRRLSNISMPF